MVFVGIVHRNLATCIAMVDAPTRRLFRTYVVQKALANAGKSTLIKILSGVIEPTEGEFIRDGRKISVKSRQDSEEKAGIQTIYQDIALVKSMSILRNIFAGREERGFFGFLKMRQMRETTMAILNEHVKIAGITSPDLMVEEAETYIESHRDQPFFMYFAMNSPHFPVQGEPKWIQYYQDQGIEYPRDIYAAFVSSQDDRIGRLVAAVERFDHSAVYAVARSEIVAVDDEPAGP